MNTRSAIDDSTGPVSLSTAFNQDCSFFAAGLDTGFCVFNSEPCALKVTRDFGAGIGLVEMLGKTNYLAIVGGGKQPKFPQNKVIIWDDAKEKAVFTLEFRTTVCRVRLTRQRLVVALQNTVHVYHFSAPPKVLSVYETADNPYGLCALSSKVVAFQGRTAGQVQLVEVDTGNVSIIPAHTSPLRALELSRDGELIATASENGTLVRVFSTTNCARLAELRRGVDHATIFSLSISPNSSMIAVTSDKSTLHVFDLPQALHASSTASSSKKRGSTASQPEEDASSHKWGVVGKIPFLPRVFSDEYSFASAPFETSDDPTPGLAPANSRPFVPIPGIPGGRPAKGLVGWLDDYTILVVGAGRDGRWEKFAVGIGEDGKRVLVKKGWKRYLGGT